MAFILSTIRLLARSHAREPFEGPLLTLGRQGIYATLDQCREALRSEGVEPRPLPEGLDTGTNVPAFRRGATAAFTNDQALFHMLCGERAETLDVSDYEDADHIHDLNRPVPESLRGRFGLIVDGGTLEHVFDVPQALRNLKAMLRPGGRIIHINPTNSWAEHGFYQFSPTLFHDFYATNGFAMRDCLLVGYPLSGPEGLYAEKAKLWRWHPGRPSAAIASKLLLTVYFDAVKQEEVDEHVPAQGEGSAGAASSRLRAPEGGGDRMARLREAAVRISPKLGGRLTLLGKKLLRRDLSSPPWGLDYLGRI